jgi:hypothetical protein
MMLGELLATAGERYELLYNKVSLFADMGPHL